MPASDPASNGFRYWSWLRAGLVVAALAAASGACEADPGRSGALYSDPLVAEIPALTSAEVGGNGRFVRVQDIDPTPGQPWAAWIDRVVAECGGEAPASFEVVSAGVRIVDSTNNVGIETLDQLAKGALDVVIQAPGLPRIAVASVYAPTGTNVSLVPTGSPDRMALFASAMTEGFFQVGVAGTVATSEPFQVSLTVPIRLKAHCPVPVVEISGDVEQ